MYLRFTLPELDPDSGREYGVFQAAHRLVESERLADWEDRQLREALRWFNVQLPAPKCYRRGRKTTICWFKKDARTCVNRIWEMIWIMREHGFNPLLFTTSRPGRVLYEDAFQVAAIPCNDKDWKARSI